MRRESGQKKVEEVLNSFEKFDAWTEGWWADGKQANEV